MRAQELADPERFAFVERCAQTARTYLATYETAGNLRVVDFRTLPDRLGHPIKVGLVFQQDRHPGVTFGYWTFVWEQVAWAKEYRLPSASEDARTGWVEEFVQTWDETFEFRDAMSEPNEIDVDGVRWIRAALVWG